MTHHASVRKCCFKTSPCVCVTQCRDYIRLRVKVFSFLFQFGSLLLIPPILMSNNNFCPTRNSFRGLVTHQLIFIADFVTYECKTFDILIPVILVLLSKTSWLYSLLEPSIHSFSITFILPSRPIPAISELRQATPWTSRKVH